MAEPLKDLFDDRVARAIAGHVAAVWPAFDGAAFRGRAADGFDGLALMDRGRHVARALREHLPEAYPEALRILVASVDERPPAGEREGDGAGEASPFLYLPHVQFVEAFGGDHFDASMRALHGLTQRFTAEFSVRPFIERYEADALALLARWAQDPNHHVRRLVSEGTRPRLPWATRLRRFQEDPTPVLPLLETLRDDPSAYVRRSVANHLNDIGKDHPDVLIDVAARWSIDAGTERSSLIRHALRSLVKQGHPDALAVLGYGDEAAVEVYDVTVEPGAVTKGGSVAIAFAVRSASPRRQRVLVDLRVHYVKANGSTAPKVYKLKAVDLPAGRSASFRKRLSMADRSTRTHHAGTHRLEALINGAAVPVGRFDLVEA